MIVVMKKNASKNCIDTVVSTITTAGLAVNLSTGDELTIIGIIGDKLRLANKNLELMDGVDHIMHVTESYKLANIHFKQSPTVVQVGEISIGGGSFVIMAGPCAVESREQLMETARIAKEANAHILRGGAYKPRTSPYSFQGLAVEGLKYMAEAKKIFGLPVITEVTDVNAVAEAEPYVDIFQVGTRNMQNFTLLKEVGRTTKPVLLKRGMSATIEEWLNAAEYILSEGNPNVILCERGIRTYETSTRNTLDLSAVPVIKAKSHLPIIVDPSHATGVRAYVAPLSKAALAAGADGLMVEVHPDPLHALSDGPQSLNEADFKKLCNELQPLAQLLGKDFKRPLA